MSTLQGHVQEKLEQRHCRPGETGVAGQWQDIVLEVAAMFGLAEGLVLEFDAIGSYIFLFVVLT